MNRPTCHHDDASACLTRLPSDELTTYHRPHGGETGKPDIRPLRMSGRVLLQALSRCHPERELGVEFARTIRRTPMFGGLI